MSDPPSPLHRPVKVSTQGRETSQLLGKRRVRIKRACDSCRKRKRKCDGQYPCDQCVGYEYPCSYPGDPDERRKDDSPEKNAGTFLKLNGSAESTSPIFGSAKRARQVRSASPSSPADSHDGDENPVESSKTHLAVVDYTKGRFSSAHSGLVLPRKLGQQIGLHKDLRLHSYGWNLGTGLEARSTIIPAVRQLLTLEETFFYGRISLNVVGLIFPTLPDHARFFARCTKYWSTDTAQSDDFEAVISCVVAIGSFFATTAAPVELQLMDHAKQILDRGSSYAPGLLSLDQAAAWLLRTIYLRLTTRPHLSWFASCATVHIIEAMGLHLDLKTVDLAAQNPEFVTTELLAIRRNLFECAMFMNALISADYGRSKVTLHSHHQEGDIGEPTRKLHHLTKLLSQIDTDLEPSQRLGILRSIHKLPNEPSIYALLKTDVAIHMYRKHIIVRQVKATERETTAMLQIMKAALSELQSFLPSKNPWWNVLSTPFQILLVLLAMDSDDSLSLVAEAMYVLRAVHDTFPTPLAAEVLETASILSCALQEKKYKQANFLSVAATPKVVGYDVGTGVENVHLPAPTEAQNMFNEWMNGEAHWDQFVDAGSWPQDLTSAGLGLT